MPTPLQVTFDISLWYVGGFSQSCDSVCSEKGGVNEAQESTLDTQGKIDSVVAKAGYYCLKYFQLTNGEPPVLETYGGRGCWYLSPGTPLAPLSWSTWQSQSWNNKICACGLSPQPSLQPSSKPSLQPTTLPSFVPSAKPTFAPIVASTGFDISLWYVGGFSQSCDSVCSGKGGVNEAQESTLDTQGKIDSVVAKAGYYCLKYFQLTDGEPPILETYGGRGCWYLSPGTKLSPTWSTWQS